MFRRLDPPSWNLSGSRAQVAAVGVMALALGLGFWGQWRLDHRSPAAQPWELALAWAPLLVGAAVFAWASRHQALEQQRPIGEERISAPSMTELVLAVGLWALAFSGFSGNRFRALPTLAWLAGLALLYLAFRRPQAGRRSLPKLRLGDGMHLSWHIVALIGIIAVGAFIRLYQLDAIPREMGVDGPLKYENAREIMEGQLMIFCPRYPGREALFFYLLAAYGKVFGLSFFAVKFTSVWLGIITIPVLYGVARSLFDRQVALIAAALLAVNKWHVILSRTGYRSVMVPLFVIVLIYLVVRAWRRVRGTDFGLAGLWLGLGLYTYNSFLLVPGVLAAALAAELVLSGRASLRRYAWGLVALALGALGVFVPEGRYAIEYPQYFWMRVASRVTGAEAPLPGDVLRVLAGNLWRAAGMFNLRGDAVFYTNVPHQREFGVLSAVVLVLGVAYALMRLRRGHYATLLIFLAGMVVPTALAIAFPHEVPNAARASGAITPGVLLAALPLALVGQRAHQAAREGMGWLRSGSLPRLGLPWPGALKAGTILAAVGAALVGIELRETWQAYFRDYVWNLPSHNYAISLELARVVDDYYGEGPVYIKIWPHWYDGNALRAQLRVTPRPWNGEITELDPARPPLANARGKMLIIVHPEDRAALDVLRSVFPRGAAVGHRNYDGQVTFITFYGER